MDGRGSCNVKPIAPFMKSGKGDEIVITGIAGKFPDSRNVYDFRDNLFNKVDLVSGDNRRWKPIHPEIPQRTGKLFDIHKFDAGFFGKTSIQAENIDPMIRMVLETAVEVLIDAGYHPSDLENTRTGVFAGVCFSDSQKFAFYETATPKADVILGNQHSMVAEQISYYLKLKAPSCSLDTACSSSMYAVEHAYLAIKRGICDKAIVCTTHLCLNPMTSLQFARLGVLSQDGSCKSFDDNGDGYARSEGNVAILLEKAKDAKRVYCEVSDTSYEDKLRNSLDVSMTYVLNLSFGWLAELPSSVRLPPVSLLGPSECLHGSSKSSVYVLAFLFLPKTETVIGSLLRKSSLRSPSLVSGSRWLRFSERIPCLACLGTPVDLLRRLGLSARLAPFYEERGVLTADDGFVLSRGIGCGWVLPWLMKGWRMAASFDGELLLRLLMRASEFNRFRFPRIDLEASGAEELFDFGQMCPRKFGGDLGVSGGCHNRSAICVDGGGPGVLECL
ncbi:hypothetical protein Trydic_g23235 [Trypoxylus dichotomus]